MKAIQILMLAAVLSPVAAFAQETRAQEIEAARDQKTAMLAPDEPTKLEQRLIRFKDDHTLERIMAGVAGFAPHMGGLPNGSGLSFGTHYRATRGRFAFDGEADLSTAGWRKFEFGVGPSNLQASPYVWDVRAARRDFGTFPTSDENLKYDLRDSTVDVLGGIRVRRGLTVGVSTGFQSVGARPEWTSVETKSDYVRAGFFVQSDTRDRPGATRRGRLITARFDDYRALDSKPYSFRRLDAEVQQFIPFFNERRVIVLRGRTVQTFTNGGNQVPIFHQPVLGGSDDLRGFRPYRFQGDNLFVVNAEYRWEAFSGLDLAVFGDMGRISSTRWDFGGLEKSAGFGMRFNVRNMTFLRVDTAYSREGVRVYIRFNNIFRDRKLNTSSAAHL